MSEKIIVSDTEENAERCQCPTCPTHNQCMKDNKERIFCSRGNTSCDLEKRGCMCPTCAVWAENKLTGYFYCEEGYAKE